MKSPSGHSEMEEAKESKEPDGMFRSQTDGVSVLREYCEGVSDYFVSVVLIRFTQIFFSLVSSFLFPFLPGLFYRIYSWLGDLHHGYVFQRKAQLISCEILQKSFLIFKQ